MKTTPRPRRSFIFTPGLNPAMFPKAIAAGADMVCVELEDGIAPKDKDAARTRALQWFAETRLDTAPELILRINNLRGAFGLADFTALLAMPAPPPAIMLPKVMTPDEVAWADDLLAEHGHATRLHIIIETARGLHLVHEIAAASPRIDALFFGGIDMAAELRCANTWQALLYARSRVVHAAAGAGLDAIDVPWLDLDDAEGMADEARRARDLGFVGKGAIHPKQIAVLNAVFSPSAEEVAYARRVVSAFEAADSGLVVVDGKLIEEPVLRTMRRVLAFTPG